MHQWLNNFTGWFSRLTIILWRLLANRAAGISFSVASFGWKNYTPL